VIVVGLLAIPALWFGPPGITSGQPFLAASHAKSYNGHLGSSPFFEVLRRGADLQVWPFLVFALIAVALALRAERDRLILGLAAAAAAWWVLVVAMTVDGYPGLERFYLPAAGIICVLGAVGVVRLALLGGAWLRARFRGAGSMTAFSVGVAVLLIAISAPFTINRVDRARAAKPTADRAVARLDQLTAAVAAVGGHNGVYPCDASYAAVNHGVQTALAWKLHVTLGRVGTKMVHPGVLFVGPHDSIDGAPAPLAHGLNRIQLITQVGVWKMYRVWRAGHPLSCVGR
jgi:hypothetical protein